MFDRLRTKEVEVVITPMLDMAFQILAFFIMTYNPMPLEGQFAMNLLPTEPQVEMQEAPSESDEPVELDVPAALRTITTLLKAGSDGHLSQAFIGENEVASLAQLKQYLQDLLADESLPYDRAVIQADPGLLYADLIRVVDVFMSQNITNISFGEAPLSPPPGSFLP